MKENPLNKVKKYYKLVDLAKIDEILAFFSDKIVYERCEKKISGIKNLEKFYKQGRKLKGKHIINLIIADNNIVSVRGSFKGINSKKKRTNLNFSDFFYLTRKEK